MIAGGGTGGHICPGIAVADAIERQRPDAEVFFMGRSGSIEERMVGKTGREFVPVPSMGLRRSLDVRNLAVPFAVAGGYLSALGRLVGGRPAAALGTGGFVSLPPILAASTLGVPVVLQEQNSYPGLATRVLSRFARSVHTSFEATTAHLPRARRVTVSGNPVRNTLLSVDRATARRDLGLSEDAFVLFLIGGSHGAHRLNAAIAEAAPALGEMDVHPIVQTGEADLAPVREAFANAGLEGIVEPFFEDVGRPFAACDLVVSRAGATGLAEVALVGRPAILVPYPYATEGHQMKNARSVEERGAAIVVPDAELTGGTLTKAIRELRGNGPQLAAMADAARALARPDAADRVARAVLALATGAPVGDEEGRARS